jgi:hypothetical protein
MQDRKKLAPEMPLSQLNKESLVTCLIRSETAFNVFYTHRVSDGTQQVLSPLQVNPLDTVKEVKWRIQDAEGLQRQSRPLFIDAHCKPASDQKTLSDYGVSEGSILTLEAQGRGGSTKPTLEKNEHERRTEKKSYSWRSPRGSQSLLEPDVLKGPASSDNWTTHRRNINSLSSSGGSELFRQSANAENSQENHATSA